MVTVTTSQRQKDREDIDRDRNIYKQRDINVNVEKNIDINISCQIGFPCCLYAVLSDIGIRDPQRMSLLRLAVFWFVTKQKTTVVNITSSYISPLTSVLPLKTTIFTTAAN